MGSVGVVRDETGISRIGRCRQFVVRWFMKTENGKVVATLLQVQEL